MNTQFMACYCAISIDVVADLEGGYVQAHIRTDTGKNITLISDSARIPEITRRIESLQHAFPGMIARASLAGVAAYHDSRLEQQVPAATMSLPPPPVAA